MDVTMVSHDVAPNPGIIADTDHDDVQVKCMHKIRANHFFLSHSHA